MHPILVGDRLVPRLVVSLYIVVYPNDRNLSSPDTISESFQGAADRVSKLMEFAVDCGIRYRDSKAGKEAVNEAIGVAGEEDDARNLREESDRFVPQVE